MFFKKKTFPNEVFYYLYEWSNFESKNIYLRKDILPYVWLKCKGFYSDTFLNK